MSAVAEAQDTVGVPFTRLDAADPERLDELLEVVAGVARRSAFTLGAEVEAFEHEFAAYCEAAEAIGVSSGTDALILALRALGVGPGHEVVVPANSFIATAEAVVLVGATPRFADVDPETQLVTAATIAEALSERTRCIVPVHLYGRMVELDPILSLAREHGAFVVEDACQAHGARYHGRRAGAIGHLGCFSFYPAKNLGAWGDGGAVVTSDPALADHVRLLRSHGERRRYHHEICGTTARLDALQAAVLRVKLRHLDADTARRRAAAARLSAALAGSPLALPRPTEEDSDHVFHLYVVRCAQRDALREHLARRSIATALHYPVPIHRTPAFAHLGVGPGALPVSERLAGELCSLPLFPGMDDQAIARVAGAVWEATGGSAPWPA